ncbi:MAG: SPOR domain-containing protein [Thiohalomonadaceae bacterium]
MASRRPKKRPQARRTISKKKPLPGWLWLLIGMSIGLLVALLVWFYRAPASESAAHQTSMAKPAAKTSAQDTRSVKKAAPAKAPEKTKQDERKLAYDFYTLLPEMEVPVPDDEPRSRGLPPTPVAPGSYTIQVGAFRTHKDADAQKANLALLGLVSAIQVITIDDYPLYRVRIGPITELERLDEVRNTLRQNDVSFMLLREKS